MEAVQGVTACLLNGNVDLEALSRAQPKPSRPTHSRQGSRAGLLHCAALFCAVLCCAMLSGAVKYRPAPLSSEVAKQDVACYTMLCHAVLHIPALPSTVLCCAVLCCAVDAAQGGSLQVELLLQGVLNIAQVFRC